MVEVRMPPSPTDTLRASQLRIAQTWQAEGHVNQAIDLYARIITRHPESEEAGQARDRLLALAERFEREGLRRVSLGLLERLEALP